jgi:predicted secreted protein
MAISGVGTIFQRWNASATPPKWETIGEIKNLSGPSARRDTLDTTTLDVEGGYRTFIAGLRDGGEITLTINFTRTGFDLMFDDFESDDLKNYEIVLPDDDVTTAEFEGLVTGMPLTIPEGVVTMDITIKISGPITINSGVESSSPGA